VVVLWDVILGGDVGRLECVTWDSAAYRCLDMGSGRRRRAACVMIACADEVIEMRLFDIRISACCTHCLDLTRTLLWRKHRVAKVRALWQRLNLLCESVFLFCSRCALNNQIDD